MKKYKELISFEKITLLFLIICLILLIFLIYTISKNCISKNCKDNIIIEKIYPYINLKNDPLTNLYTPPLRDERYLYNTPFLVPINISTNIGAVDTEYRQLGILNSTNTKDKIIPLMGRPLFTNRDKWQYYTISAQNNSIKLPISKNGKSCTNEYGCDKLYNGDTIYVEGLNEPYNVTIYENNTFRYLPFF